MHNLPFYLDGGDADTPLFPGTERDSAFFFTFTKDVLATHSVGYPIVDSDKNPG